MQEYRWKWISYPTSTESKYTVRFRLSYEIVLKIEIVSTPGLKLFPPLFIFGTACSLTPKGKVLFQFELAIKTILSCFLIQLSCAGPLDQGTELGVGSICVENTVTPGSHHTSFLEKRTDFNMILGVKNLIKYTERTQIKGPCNLGDTFQENKLPNNSSVLLISPAKQILGNNLFNWICVPKRSNQNYFTVCFGFGLGDRDMSV